MDKICEPRGEIAGVVCYFYQSKKCAVGEFWPRNGYVPPDGEYGGDGGSAGSREETVVACFVNESGEESLKNKFH